jgi:hypothetical protein
MLVCSVFSCAKTRTSHFGFKLQHYQLLMLSYDSTFSYPTQQLTRWNLFAFLGTRTMSVCVHVFFVCLQGLTKRWRHQNVMAMEVVCSRERRRTNRYIGSDQGCSHAYQSFISGATDTSLFEANSSCNIDHFSLLS